MLGGGGRRGGEKKRGGFAVSEGMWEMKAVEESREQDCLAAFLALGWASVW